MAMSTALRLAQSILNGFDALFADFQNITLTAKVRFERADWHAVHEASSERMGLYRRKVVQISELMRTLAGEEVNELRLWQDTKQNYIRLIANNCNFEIAESFFNSIFGVVFDHLHINDENAFVLSSQMRKSPVADLTIFNTYRLNLGLTDLVSRILEDYTFIIPFEDKARDVRNIVQTVKRQIIHGRRIDPRSVRVDVIEPIFFRNKGAYLVGRIYLTNECVPFVLPFLNNEAGAVYVDTLICDSEDVSIIFSFTRSYFMVDAQVPSKIVGFLETLMPCKPRSELYSCIGFKKHSKTAFYRHFVEHLTNSDDKFVIAPGIKGMVMSVFTLPSYDIVFKIIKDKFAPPKEVTKEIVKQKYKLVTHHDRVGRMADTQEFSHFTFDRDRFCDELLEELKKVAPSLLTITEDRIIIEHLYTERRMVPLNLYLADISDEQTLGIMDEYGNAIKQLSAANIFPGDMLLKNFGVTRHGRVVFYDYDEICHLTDCNFRKIPQAQTEEQAMSSSPWYSVAENDIFPEEFSLFFSGNPRARKAFEILHSDLYDVEFWKGLQEDIKLGNVMDVFPYRRKKCFDRQRHSPIRESLQKRLRTEAQK